MRAMIPAGPGLGVAVNEKLVREKSAAYMEAKPWRNPVWRDKDGTIVEW
jgi:galactonate dehydratase